MLCAYLPLDTGHLMCYLVCATLTGGATGGLRGTEIEMAGEI